MSCARRSGPAIITHIWITIASLGKYHLKNWSSECIGMMSPHPAWKVPLAIFSASAWETTFSSIGSSIRCAG